MEYKSDGDGIDQIFAATNRSRKRYGAKSRGDNDPKYSSADIRRSIKRKLIQNAVSNKPSTFVKSSDKSGRMIRPHGKVFIYQCSCCYYESPYRFTMKSHAKSCKQPLSKILLECPKCNIKYNLEDLFTEDNVPADLSILDERVFHCPACSMRDLNGSEITILKQVHINNNKSMKCPCCNVKIPGFSTLKRHLVTEHGITIKYRCEYCKYTSSESKNLREHKKSHIDLQEMGVIQCSHCHLDFLTINEFKDHIRQVQWQNEGKKESNGKGGGQRGVKKRENFEFFLSSDCKNETPVDDDISNLANIGNLLLKCTLCQYMNYSKESCERHVKNKHRPFGHAIVRFGKYYGHHFRGSVNIGNVKDQEDYKQGSTEELLRILDCTEFDKDDNIHNTATDVANDDKVITIEMASDSDDENEDSKVEIAKSEGRNAKFNNKEGTTSKYIDTKFIFNCNECEYKAKNKVNLLIHQILVHDKFEDSNVYKCPKKGCKYNGTEKIRLRSHLKKFHKHKLEMFYPKELKCPYCVYTGKLPHHLLLHRRSAHTDRLVKKFKIPITAAKGKYVTIKKNIRTIQVKSCTKNSDFRCKHCGLKHQKMYRLAWHMFESHGNKSELQKWCFKCKMCSYESCSKLDCRKHGLQHKRPHLKFYKYYNGKFKGGIGFRYKLPQIYDDILKKSALEDNFDKTEEKCLMPKKEAINSEKEKIIPNGKDYYREPTQLHKSPNHTNGSIKILDQAHLGNENYVNDIGGVKNISTSNNNKYIEDKQEDDVLLVKTAEFYTCSQCSYEAEFESYFKIHQHLVHGDRKIRSKKCKYHCINCEFRTVYRHSLKRHLGDVHGYNPFVFYTEEQATAVMQASRKKNNSNNKDIIQVDPLASYLCQVCSCQYENKYLLDWHTFKNHSDKTELMKWKLRCTLCKYETFSKRYAQGHGFGMHSIPSGSTNVIFEKYYKDNFQGNITFTVKKRRTHRCTKCHYVSTKRNNLRKHYRIHRIQGGPKPGIKATNKKKNMDLDTTIIDVKQRKIEPAVEEENKKDIRSGKGQQTEIIRIEIVSDSDDEGQDFPTNKEFELNDDFTKSYGDDISEAPSQKGFYSEQQILDLIELNRPKIQKENNFVHLPSAEYKMESSEEQFFGAEQEENIKIFIYKSKSSKCIKGGRNSHKKATAHINPCIKKSTRRVNPIFTCPLCDEVLSHRNSLQTHRNSHATALNNPNLELTFLELKNDSFTSDIEISYPEGKAQSKGSVPKNSTKYSFRCWTCGVVLVKRKNLKSHTLLHAKQYDDLNLKVRYSRLVNNKLAGTIIMQADPNCQRKPANSPGSDPSRLVLSCDECNFKTNVDKELKKHKNLHWTPQKDAMFKAKKWFNCRKCSFSCFDRKKFNEHCEWHKTHSSSTGR